MAATYSPVRRLADSTIGHEGLIRQLADRNGKVSYPVKTKKPPEINQKAFNKYGSYLLSRILVQYHRP